MARDGLPQLDGNTALFLDVDGTLVDIAPVPDAVIVPPGLGDVLRRLRAGLDGALALVSGRPLAGIDALFAPLRLPAAGQHGAELRLRGDTPPIALTRDPALDILAERAMEIAVERPGVLVEDKGLSIAIHYRLAPQYREELHRLAAELVAGSGAGIELLPVRMGVELKSRAISKGSAIEWFMRAPPFHGRVPVFVGDDRTDEFGFAAVLKLGGQAIRVGDLGPSLAPLRLASPHAVRDWLAAASATLR
jgi:trehalose 6-phosphate phosphatase